MAILQQFQVFLIILVFAAFSLVAPSDMGPNNFTYKKQNNCC